MMSRAFYPPKLCWAWAATLQNGPRQIPRYKNARFSWEERLITDARIHGRCSDTGKRSAFAIGACWTLALSFLARISIASSNDLHVPTGEPSLEAKKDGPSQRIRPSGPRYTKRALLPIWLAPLMNLFSLSHGMDFRFCSTLNGFHDAR